MLKREMMREVCEFFKVKVDDINSHRRDINIVFAKKTIYYVLRKYGFSFNQIGRMVNKDHDTILRTLRNMTPNLKKYAEKIYKKYQKLGIEEEIQNKQIILRKQRRIIIELLNKNYPVGQIAFETHLDKEFINQQIAFFLKENWRKKVPDYAHSSYKIIFFEKN